MGNDGGSIPKRNELVKEAAKALTAAQIKEAQTEQQEYGWTTDPLTRKPLARPVVSDGAGVLYNKESIIEYLLKEEGGEKAEMRKVGGVKGTVEGGFSELGTFGDRVKGLKDVVEVNFEILTAESEDNGRGERWVCPITGNALGPGTKAVYIVPCGHAFAGSVVKEVNETTCLTVSSLPFHKLRNTVGSAGNLETATNFGTVQRALRRKRRYPHPSHSANRYRSSESASQDSQGERPHTRTQESTRQQEEEEEHREGRQRRGYRERRQDLGRGQEVIRPRKEEAGQAGQVYKRRKQRHQELLYRLADAEGHGRAGGAQQEAQACAE